MSSCGKCSRKTDFIALGRCLPCLEDAGFTQSEIEESLYPASTVPQKSNIAKQPTKSNPIFPFASASLQSRSVTQTIPSAKSVIPTSASARSLPSTNRSVPDGHFENVVKTKRRKTLVVPISKKKSSSSSSKAKSTSKATTDDEGDSERIIDCGFVLYVQNKLIDTGIFNVKQKVNLKNPDLCIDLALQLWSIFSDELNKKLIITEDQMPESVGEFLSLSQGKGRLATVDALIFILQKSTPLRPVQIDIVYQHPFSINQSSDEIETVTKSSSRSSGNKSSRKSRTRSTGKQSHILVDCTDNSSDENETFTEPSKCTSSSNLKQKSPDSSQNSSDENVIFNKPSNPASAKRIAQVNPSRGSSLRKNQNFSVTSDSAGNSISGKAWASGGLACTMPRNLNAGLSTQLRVLGGRCIDYVRIDNEGWVNGHRFIFKNFSHNQYESLSADVEPIIFRVDQDVVVGEGSMRRAYKAEVKTKSSDGSEKISNYIAKIRYNEQYQTVANHAADALLYEASGLLLGKFKSIVSGNNRVSLAYKRIAGNIQIIRHSIVAEGDYNNPNEVYFFEAALEGPYLKYCSNIDFDVAATEPEMDTPMYRLMNCFTHWSYIQSKGKTLICDLQGVGFILTDPQIIDFNPKLWADGNNAQEGIVSFVKHHICNEVCEMLRFQKPQLIEDEETLPPSRFQSSSSGRLSHHSNSNQHKSTSLRATISEKAPTRSIQIQPTPRAKSSLAHIIDSTEVSNLNPNNYYDPTSDLAQSTTQH
ncbi:hypothetical protein MJO28_010577 [Puccinia striiformis f. sp. tritici]|uniref:Uncharacterized protein n=1 Tax=Puccinia striiformis f. sp. tritici TaxID=168172 RepID=A0ACC0E5F4_9BASI|nr:hypothetical protein MJO28_010577 [Puccinia striiformis f. sp. tritici]